MRKKYLNLGIVVLLLLSAIAFLRFLGFLPQGISYCNGMFGVDYGAAYDGPYYYVTLPSFKTVSTCGGACMLGGCPPHTCPPPSWTCSTY
jgi:hypothetical protein